MCFYLPLCLLVAVSVSQAVPPVDEIWEFAQMDGARVGYVHTTTTADADGKILHVLSELNLTLKRYGSTVRLRMEQGLDESSAGKIFGVSMNQYQDKELNLSLKGKLEAKGMHVVIANKGIDRHLHGMTKSSVSSPGHDFGRRRSHGPVIASRCSPTIPK